jgi:hypothetical protein
MMNLKEMIQGKVRFRFYRDANLYYETENGILFPVPVADIGTATFLAEDKAILFMRYIRQFIAACEKAKADHDVPWSESMGVNND